MDFWQYWLTFHPDQQLVSTILSYIQDGIPVEFKGPDDHYICNNWKSAHEYANEVESFIHTHLERGAIIGPLHDLPAGYRASPLGAFKKKRSSKVRVIHDLSWPPGGSVNDFINAKDATVTYVSVDHAANNCMLYDTPWLTKIDIQSAFLSCHVRPEDSKLLGFSWTNKQGQRLCYMMQVLAFGLKTSPKKIRRHLKSPPIYHGKKGGITISHSVFR